LRAIRAESPITSKEGKPIQLPRESETEWHGIVMVSEMLPSVDWTAVAAKLLAAATKTGAIFSVLDLQELRVLVGVSDDNPLKFRQHLCRRSEILNQCRSALIQTRVQGPPPP